MENPSSLAVGLTIGQTLPGNRRRTVLGRCSIPPQEIDAAPVSASVPNDASEIQGIGPLIRIASMRFFDLVSYRVPIIDEHLPGQGFDVAGSHLNLHGERWPRCNIFDGEFNRDCGR